MKQTNVWVKCRYLPALKQVANILTLKQVAHILTLKQELHGSVKTGAHIVSLTEAAKY
jgi:hypothetical protein